MRHGLPSCRTHAVIIRNSSGYFSLEVSFASFMRQSLKTIGCCPTKISVSYMCRDCCISSSLSCCPTTSKHMLWQCPDFCAHLFLMDYCSFVNLHRFVKFASVQILASSPFCCQDVSESCFDHLLSPI